MWESVIPLYDSRRPAKIRQSRFEDVQPEQGLAIIGCEESFMRAVGFGFHQNVYNCTKADLPRLPSLTLVGNFGFSIDMGIYSLRKRMKFRKFNLWKSNERTF